MTNIIQKSSINWDMIMIWNAIGYITNNLKKEKCGGATLKICWSMEIIIPFLWLKIVKKTPIT